MHSRTEEFWVALGLESAEEHYPRVFQLYEEYSKRALADTIRMRRANFEKADTNRKKQLQAEVEEELKGFTEWLEETKGFERTSAHYYSISLKSLLVGLPIGVQVASIFDAILDRQT
jgi:hypothetical protein